MIEKSSNSPIFDISFLFKDLHVRDYLKILCETNIFSDFFTGLIIKRDCYFSDTCDSEKIESLVCWLYSSTLAQLPAIVRQWWTGLDSKLAQTVDKVTQYYVSQHLVVQELSDLLTYQNKFKNMIVSN